MQGKTPLVLEELARYRPGEVREPASRQEALLHCERLARGHYENFVVASMLLPRDKRRHLYSIYAYCRWSDDLADEIADPKQARQLLDAWREELHACYAGHPTHPVYVALRETIEAFDIPMEPFEDLLDAFIQDQHVTRYEGFSDLLAYCRRSANPVGRIFLHLFGHRDAERMELSDCTCTALQLTNFWQDIAGDFARGRVYLPQEDLRRFGYTEDDLANRRVNAAFCRLMHFESARTRDLFDRGRALPAMVEPRLRPDLDLFSRGGLEILRQIERNGYDVFRRRPTLSRGRKLALFLRRIAEGRLLTLSE